MQICYIDESGDLGALPLQPLANGNDQPVFVLSGLILNTDRLESLTNDFLNLKHRFFPGLAYPSTNHLDRIIPEVKGADVRRDALRGNRNQRRQAIGFLDKTLDLIENHQSRLVTRIWIKAPGEPFDSKAVYTSSVQAIHSYFDQFLANCGETRFCIADSRNKPKNVNVSHSIFTRKFQASTSFYSRIIELPTFGHSDNHAALQLCDVVCSAVLFPIACQVYSSGTISNIHIQPDAALLRQRYGTRIKALQYRYKEPTGNYKGGIVVSDKISRRNASLMFK